MFGLSKTESVRCLRWQPTTLKSRGNRRRPHKNYKQPWNSFNYNWTEDLIFVPEYFSSHSLTMWGTFYILN